MASQLNKLAQFVQQNPLAVTQFGAGLLSQPTIGQGVQAGLLGAMQAKQWSDQREEKKKREEALKQLLTRFPQANGPIQDLGGGVTSQDLPGPLQENQPNQYGLTQKDALMTEALGPQYLSAKLSQGGGQGFTLGTNQNRYDAAGNLIVEGPKKSASESKTQRERQIEDAMFQLGMNKQEATKYVDGYVTLKTNPVTGRTDLVDSVTGTSTPLKYTGSPVYTEPKRDPNMSSMFSMLDNAYGFGPTFKEKWAKTGGQFTGDAAPDIQKAKQHGRQIKESLIRAYTDTNKPPVMQQERVLKMIPDTDTFWENPESAGYTFTQMVAEIQSDRARLMQMANNPYYPADQQKEAIQRLSDLDRALELIGDPSEFQPGTRVENASSKDLFKVLLGDE